jgi:uncharacterized damage-inducible protein DinB
MTMLYGGKELANSFRGVRKNTIQIAEDIPESHYNHLAAPDCKTVAQMFVHIVLGADVRYQLHQVHRVTSFVGYDFTPIFQHISAEEAKPRTKTEVLDMLHTQGDQFAAWLESLTPEFLAETVAEPPDGKTGKSRFELILSAKEHEMHHRAQLMLIERQLGIVPHLTRQFQERMAQMTQARPAKA